VSTDSETHGASIADGSDMSLVTEIKRNERIHYITADTSKACNRYRNSTYCNDRQL